MKKFTKGCLITAVALLVIGTIFCAVFGALGGYEQLDQNGERVYNLGFNGLKFGYDGNSFGFGYWEDEWDEEWDKAMESLKVLDITHEKVKTEYTASDVTDIVIGIGGNNLVIEESEDEHIWIENNSSEKTVKYGVNNGRFELRTRKKVDFVHFEIESNSENGKIHLYLPKGMKLETLDLELEGGNITGIALEADEMIVAIGAGNLTIDGLSAETMEVVIGAGKADINKLDAQNVTFEVGAGTLKMDDFTVGEMIAEVGMGNLTADGSIAEKAEIECGMGNITLDLQGKESDFNYNVECAMGNVKIGGIKMSNLAEERTVDNGSEHELNVECAMGNITIDFE